MEAVVLFSEDLGNDVVLGQGIVQLLLGLRLLLNGDTGRLDCGSVDSFIRHYIALHNFEPDKEVLNDG